MMKQLMTALAFAADKHKNQRRKDADASPYIVSARRTQLVFQIDVLGSQRCGINSPILLLG